MLMKAEGKIDVSELCNSKTFRSSQSHFKILYDLLCVIFQFRKNKIISNIGKDNSLVYNPKPSRCMQEWRHSNGDESQYISASFCIPHLVRPRLPQPALAEGASWDIPLPTSRPTLDSLHTNIRHSGGTQRQSLPRHQSAEMKIWNI